MAHGGAAAAACVSLRIVLIPGRDGTPCLQLQDVFMPGRLQTAPGMQQSEIC
jgi:hypothetical protein